MKKMLTSLAICFLPYSAAACTLLLTPKELELEYQFGQADAVFIAQVVESTYRARGVTTNAQDGQLLRKTVAGPNVIALEVIEVLKDSDGTLSGDAPIITWIIKDFGSCGVQFRIDERYLVFGERVLENTFTASAKKGTERLPESEEKLVELRQLLAIDN